MTPKQPPIGVRLPDELKAWIKQAAADSRRSVNSEIIVRLEASRKAEEHAREQQGATP